MAYENAALVWVLLFNGRLSVHNSNPTKPNSKFYLLFLTAFFISLNPIIYFLYVYIIYKSVYNLSFLSYKLKNYKYVYLKSFV